MAAVETNPKADIESCSEDDKCLMVVSPKALYAEKCTKIRCHQNTRVIRDLPSSFSELSKIRELNYSANIIGRRGVGPLLEVIGASCVNLVALCLSSNYLNNESIETLCTLMLTKLKTSKTNFEFTHGTNIKDKTEQTSPTTTFYHFPCLATLDISFNPISNPGGKILSKLVDGRPGLRALDLIGTLINAGLVKLIQEKLRKRSVVRLEALQALNEVGGDQSKGKAMVNSSDSNIETPSSSSTVPCPAEVMPRYSAIETIWRFASKSSSPDGDWSGLASVMAVVRQDYSMAMQHLHTLPS
eukprot:Tbor_TRINITY_DN5008_c0_g2::TRINITY_DN5008_c0_g2_i1::g.14205::m.14205